ncbi:MAG TPA: response regulator [Gemmatimonadales bacterium]|jgi:CheY-like chemotaxis protein
MSPHELSLALFRPPIVLVVEDRPRSRFSTSRLVSALGYEVRGARNGEQALRLLRHHPGLFDLVLSDILLPDMDGGEFTGRVRLEEPGIRVAWIADFVPMGLAAQLIAEQPQIPVVQKPFGFRELHRVLTPLLGPPRAAVPLSRGTRVARRRTRRTIP